MNRLSVPMIERYLQEYSLGIEMWAPDIGDTDQVYGARVLLHDVLADLSPAQLHRLEVADARAIAFFAAHRNARTFDVAMLRDIATLIDSERLRQAA